jgi:hypothetical protein
MLVLGGTGMLYGGLVGAIIFMVARDQLSGVNPQLWYFWIGLLLVLVVLIAPGGLLRWREALDRMRAAWKQTKGRRIELALRFAGAAVVVVELYFRDSSIRIWLGAMCLAVSFVITALRAFRQSSAYRTRRS